MFIRYPYPNPVLFIVDLKDREAFAWAVDATLKLKAVHERLHGAVVVLCVPFGQAAPQGGGR